MIEWACNHAFEFDSRVLIEAYILGQELSVAVLKTDDIYVVSQPCQATRFKAIADFEEKYTPQEQETLFDLPYSQNVLDKVVKDSRFIFDIFDCRHLSRIDPPFLQQKMKQYILMRLTQFLVLQKCHYIQCLLKKKALLIKI